MKNPYLHERALELVKSYKKSELDLLNILSEIDEQRTYLELGYSNLFEYSTKALGLSERQSYAFMSVAKKSREVPELKKWIAAGEITVSKAIRIVPILKSGSDATAWIKKAADLPRRELEIEVAKVSPQPAKREIVKVENAEESRIHLNLSHHALRDFKRLQSLFSRDDGEILSLEKTLAKALRFCLKRRDPVEKAKRAQAREIKKTVRISARAEKVPTSPAFPQTRSFKNKRNPIPSALLHRVHQRDGGECQFKSEMGRQCQESWFTEIHHIQPVALGGQNEIRNLTTLCHSHHANHHRVD